MDHPIRYGVRTGDDDGTLHVGARTDGGPARADGRGHRCDRRTRSGGRDPTGRRRSARHRGGPQPGQGGSRPPRGSGGAGRRHRVGRLGHGVRPAARRGRHRRGRPRQQRRRDARRVRADRRGHRTHLGHQRRRPGRARRRDAPGARRTVTPGRPRRVEPVAAHPPRARTGRGRRSERLLPARRVHRLEDGGDGARGRPRRAAPRGRLGRPLGHRTPRHRGDGDERPGRDPHAAPRWPGRPQHGPDRGGRRSLDALVGHRAGRRRGGVRRAGAASG